MRGRIWALAAVSAIAIASAARSQPPIPPTVTDIAADVGQLSLGTDVSAAGTVTTIAGGTRAGANLFHSFSRFDLGAGDTARFVAAAPAGIDNVISRVTGGQRSVVLGTIDSQALPNADFWFVNPAGILFGPGARLDVPAAARFSTGSELRFADAPAFAVTTPGGSTLSVASPTAFGFVGGEGGITVVGGDRALLPDGGRLTLAGADVSLVGSNLAGGVFQLLGAGGQPIELLLADPLAAPLAGSVTVDGSTLRLDGAAFGTGGIRIGAGTVEILASDLGTARVNGPDQGISGPITLQGDSVSLRDSVVSASTFGPEAAAPILITGGDISIERSVVANDARIGSTGEAGLIGIRGDEISFEGSLVTSSTQTAQSGGGIAIESDRIVIGGGSFITSSTLEQATGDAGAILIGGGSLDLLERSGISSTTFGAGNAGAILIELAGAVTLDAGGIESAASEDSSGDAGLIGIVAPSLTLRNESLILTDTFGAGAGGLIGIDVAEILVDGESTISAGSNFGGDGGGIDITSDRLVLDNGGSIGSDTFGSGQGGGIEIEAGEIVLARGAAITSNSFDLCVDEVCAPTGGPGGILITADRLRMIGFANFEGDPTSIRTDGGGSRAAGSITLRLGTLEMSGIAGIEADNFGSGVGGLVAITAGDIALRDKASISSGAFDSGPGGEIAIEAGTLLLDDDASIRSESFSRTGAPAGRILIDAGSTTVRRSGITTSSQGDGDAGPIQILGGRLEVDRAEIVSNTQGAGRAGDILVDVDEVVVRNEGRISSDSNPCYFEPCTSGDAGSVTIIADSLTMIGDQVQSIVTSRTLTNGNAGGVFIRVGRLDMDYAAFTTSTISTGNAGTIDIEAGEISLTTVSSITSRAVPLLPDPSVQGGNAGSIRIASAGQITLSADSLISTETSGVGNAGTIEIVAPSLVLREQSAISTATSGAGAGGLIGISAAEILVDSLSVIESASNESATGNAGRVVIEGGRLTLANGGAIASDTFGTGDGGGIEIAVGEIEISGEGRISSDSLIECAAEPCASGGKAGDIAIAAGTLRILGPAGFGPPSPAISSDSRTAGDAGSIDLRLGRLEMDGNLFISSDTSGSGAGGTVMIAADAVVLRNLATISTRTTGAGAGGSILIDTASLLMESDSRILSQSLSGFGAPGGTVTIRAQNAIIRGSEINSSGLASGDAGDIEIDGGRLELDLGAILSDTQGAGQGGDVLILSREVVLRNSSLIAADSLGCFLAICDSIGDAGSVTIIGDSLTIGGAEDAEIGLQPAKISSEAFSTGDAGDIVIRVERLSLDIGTISSGTQAEGDAGTIDIEAGEVSLVNFSAIQTGSTPFCPDGICLAGGDAGSVLLRARGDVRLAGFSQISSNTSASGDAGGVAVAARNLSLEGSRITTASELGAAGEAGAIAIEVGELLLTDGSEISSEASNARPAGAIAIRADRVRIQDPLSLVSSGNNADGDAGAVLIETGALDLVEGGRISTSSAAGAAGDIGIVMPAGSLLRLIGRRFVSEITTSSGPGTGGRITIASPFAIISDGGSILALGEQGGANVAIQTGFFIRSADRVNRVAVDGDFLLEAQVGDVSSGTVERDLSILDASGVLRGQCAATRATGQVSQLVVRPVGPYGRTGAAPAATGSPCE